MKTKIAAALCAIVAMLTPACEKHDWEKETSQLFKSHGDHGAGHSGDHGKPGDHPKDEAKKPH